MSTIITIVKNPSIAGAYEVTQNFEIGKRSFTHYENGVQSAAARAIQLSKDCRGQYRIYGPEEVLKVIDSGGISGDSSK